MIGRPFYHGRQAGAAGAFATGTGNMDIDLVKRVNDGFPGGHSARQPALGQHHLEGIAFPFESTGAWAKAFHMKRAVG